ncbi:C2 [callitrichine gammaherpesvirus 3]|uniref:C2 n=1 Tax=callitrichine gammaherpesvirus 3 TaxID=106331 RepID=Q993K2_9GAMA|nr:C2 [callitrichine gammaherpesvirus 3]AAK38216.1 C2 [callitrichine gammaherpesvirus 3]
MFLLNVLFPLFGVFTALSVSGLSSTSLNESLALLNNSLIRFPQSSDGPPLIVSNGTEVFMFSPVNLTCEYTGNKRLLVVSWFIYKTSESLAHVTATDFTIIEYYEGYKDGRITLTWSRNTSTTLHIHSTTADYAKCYLCAAVALASDQKREVLEAKTCVTLVKSGPSDVPKVPQSHTTPPPQHSTPRPKPPRPTPHVPGGVIEGRAVVIVLGVCCMGVLLFFCIFGVFSKQCKRGNGYRVI